MPTTTMTSREFNQESAGAKRAAAGGPVFITDRGQPAHVLLSIEEYRRLTRTGPTIAELLASPETVDIDFEVPRSRDLPRLVDLA